MDELTLAIAIAIMRNLPGTAAAEAIDAAEQAQAVLDSIPDDYTALVGRVDALESLGFYLDADGYICQN